MLQPRRSTRNLPKAEAVVKTEAEAKVGIRSRQDGIKSSGIKSRDIKSRGIKREASSPLSSPPSSPSSSAHSPQPTKKRRIKKDLKKEKGSHDSETAPTPSSSSKRATLQARKLKSFTAFSSTSPFPSLAHPTPAECALAHRILASLHGERERPKEVVAPTDLAGCGNSPSVLDALVRTILSQNTSDKNSSRAKRAMDAAYGGSDSWAAIVAGGQPMLQKTIQSGGLSVVKSKVIISILRQAHEKYGEYSLDHLFQASDEDAMREMLSFQGVGPKTASCVLLFCLQRASFAVDTHVYRLAGLLGWRPASASREETQAHLDAVVPDEEKYPLHVLFLAHGKQCDECKAGGKNLGKCELRKAFRKARAVGEAGEKAKDEELETIKKEAEDDDKSEIVKQEVKEELEEIKKEEQD